MPLPASNESGTPEPYEDAEAGRLAVEQAARSLRAAQEDVAQRDLALARALHDAHLAGCSWRDLARASGLGTAEAARQRAYRGRPEQTLPPSAVSVAEAARRLGVAPKTVYRWIDSGLLDTTRNTAGRTRVILQEPAKPPVDRD